MSPTPRRPNPRQALDSILSAPTHDEALARMTRLLARAWSSGSYAGAQEQDDFHGDVEPVREAINPYRR